MACCCRGRSGRLRSLPALYQDDNDGNDLSDLGLSTGKKNNVDDDDHESSKHRTVDHEEDVFCGVGEPVATASVKVATVASTITTDHPVAVENGYDRAIKDYVDFAESKRTSVAKCEEQQQKQQQSPSPRKALAEVKRRMSAPKIEEKVMLLKTWSQSTKDLNAGVSELPKVDIVKRREIFEKICSETKAAAEVLQTAGKHQASAVAKKKSPVAVTAVSTTIPSPNLLPPVAVICTDDRPQHAIKEISQPETPATGN